MRSLIAPLGRTSTATIQDKAQSHECFAERAEQFASGTACDEQPRSDLKVCEQIVPNAEPRKARSTLLPRRGLVRKHLNYRLCNPTVSIVTALKTPGGMRAGKFRTRR